MVDVAYHTWRSNSSGDQLRHSGNMCIFTCGLLKLSAGRDDSIFNSDSWLWTHIAFHTKVIHCRPLVEKVGAYKDGFLAVFAFYNGFHVVVHFCVVDMDVFHLC